MFNFLNKFFRNISKGSWFRVISILTLALFLAVVLASCVQNSIKNKISPSIDTNQPEQNIQKAKHIPTEDPHLFQEIDTSEKVTEAFISITSGTSNITLSENHTYYVHGITSSNCSRIIVEFQNSISSEIRIIQNYELGDTTFKYDINEGWGNIKPGANHYDFSAHCDGDQQIKKVSIDINYAQAAVHEDTQKKVEAETSQLNTKLREVLNQSIENRLDVLTHLITDRHYAEWLTSLGLSPTVIAELRKGKESYIHFYDKKVRETINYDVIYFENVDKIKRNAEDDFLAKSGIINREILRLIDTNTPQIIGSPMITDAGEFVIPAYLPGTQEVFLQSGGMGWEVKYFHGYRCMFDCSGHEAGYGWAAAKGIKNPANCGGDSQSFIEGCQAYAEETRKSY